MKDTIYNQTRTKFSFKDRLKILIGGTCHVDTEIETDNEIVHVIKSKSTAWAVYPDWIQNFIRNKKGGMEIIETPINPEP